MLSLQSKATSQKPKEKTQKKIQNTNLLAALWKLLFEIWNLELKTYKAFAPAFRRENTRRQRKPHFHYHLPML